MKIKRIQVILPVLAVLIFLIVLSIYFILPKFDFMYVSADKHWQKEKIADNDAGEGGKKLNKVVQGEDGTYFVYENRLMYMENENAKIKEICKMQRNISGILVKDKNIFLREESGNSIYKLNTDGEIISIIYAPGIMYLEGNNIYTLSGGTEFEKYDFNGKRIFKNDLGYNGFDRDNTIFNNYVFNIDFLKAEVYAPKYYLFDINKIKYKEYTLHFSKYYLPPETWDSYLREEVIPYDSFAKEMDKKVRKGEIIDRNLDNYELQSIELSIGDFSEVSDGYIYFLGEQKLTYRDKNYKDKFFGNMNEYINTYENKECMSKIKYDVKLYPIGRVKVDDIKNILDSAAISYDAIDRPLSNSRNRNDFTIRDKKVYISYIEDYVENNQEYRELKIYEIDAETGISKEVYTMKGISVDERMIEIFLTDNYIFIYRYIDNSGKLCITRINRDGSNPVLVMDENGEVVMKPIQ